MENRMNISPGWQYGDVLVDLQQYADARVAFERARLTDPYRAQIEAASAALTAEEHKAAEEIFRAVLKEDAGHYTALCGLAALSLEADRAADAEQLLRHALKQIRAPSARVARTRGLRWSRSAAWWRPKRRRANLIRIEPNNPQSWLTIANVATQLMRRGGGPRGLRAEAAPPTLTRFGCACPLATCKKPSAGAPTAKLLTRRPWPWIQGLRKPTGA